MPIWIPPAVATEPNQTLISWRVFKVLVPEIGSPTTHIVGYNLHVGEGRVTSPIVALDTKSRCAVSESGRVHYLSGLPGNNADAQYLWQRWLEIWGAEVLEDVSEEALAQFAEGDEHD